MVLTRSDVAIENLFSKRSITVATLVDTGAVFMSIPAHHALQLGFDLTEVSARKVVLADGSRKSVPMISPLRVRYADRYCDLSALVLGDEPLLGAVPIEMMDLIVTPGTQSLSIIPESPFVPTASAK